MSIWTDTRNTDNNGFVGVPRTRFTMGARGVGTANSTDLNARSVNIRKNTSSRRNRKNHGPFGRERITVDDGGEIRSGKKGRLAGCRQRGGWVVTGREYRRDTRKKRGVGKSVTAI